MGSADYHQIATQEGASNGPVVTNNGRRCLSNLSNETFGEVLIFASQFFFGISFSCQRVAMVNGMKPLTYNAFRFIISVFVLALYLWLTKTPILEEDPEDYVITHLRQREELETAKAKKRKETIFQLVYWGCLLGVMSVGGSMLQQIGLVTVTAGKTGFITGMYVIFVPIVEYLFPCFHTTLSCTSIVATFISLAGVYLLSGCAEQETCFGGAIQEGEVIVFISMFFWVGSIVFADLASKQLDGVWLTMIEFSLTAVVTIFAAIYFESEEWVFPFVSAQNNWQMIVLVGITEALAFALSTVGQTYSSPTRAALLYSLEAVVCAFCAYLFLGETLTLIECFGGFLMFLAALCTSSAVVDDGEENSEIQRNLQRSDSFSRSLDETQNPIMVQYSGFGSLEMTKSEHLSRQHAV